MRVKHTERFDVMLARLPKKTKTLFELQEQRLKISIEDPRLHLKKLKGTDDVYSTRITRVYRALFVWDDDGTIWFYAIGHRKDIYRHL